MNEMYYVNVVIITFFFNPSISILLIFLTKLFKFQFSNVNHLLSKCVFKLISVNIINLY